MYEYQLPNRNGLHHKKPIIKVYGEGELAIQPDSASVNIGILTENKELTVAQQQNSQEMSKVLTSLSSLGISKKALQTFDYRVESDYDFNQGKQIFRGYKVSHILQVKIEDLSMIGKVVDTSVQNGANYISNVQFTAKNKETFYLQALTLALNHVIKKAKAIAYSLGVTLNPIPILVMEVGELPHHPIYSHQETFVKGISSTQFEPGQIVVKSSISAEFRYNMVY